MNKQLILITAILMVTAGPVFACCGFCDLSKKGSNHDEWKKAKIEKMTTELGLSADQVTQVEALLSDKIEKKKAVWDEAKKEKAAIREEYKTKLKSILTAEQLEKHTAMMEEKESKREHKGSDYEHEKGSDSEKKGS